MLSCHMSGGRRTLQKILAFECHGASAMRSPLVKGTPFVLQQSRTARSKLPNDFYTNAQRQDERLLKRLEAQLANAKARLKRDEEAALAYYKRQMEARRGGKGKAQDDSAFFFQSMLTRMDRAKLAMHGIWNFDQLYYVYVEADALMKRPPFPKLEDLGAKHRAAHEMYKKIPEKVADSTPWGPDHSGI